MYNSRGAEALETTRDPTSVSYRQGFLAGLLVGLLMGLVDTYGYATTGYTTAELSLLITPVLIRILCGGRASVKTIVVGSVTAYGMSFATIITSGMLITNAYTEMVYEKFFYGHDYPTWLYSPGGCLVWFLCPYIPTYMYTGVLSLSGVVLAYLYRHVFIDKLQLPYPIAITSFMISGFVSRLRSFRDILLVASIGLVLQLLVFVSGGLSIDLTPMFNSVLRGSVFSLSLSFIILFLSLVLPVRVSASISLGSILTALLILPLGYALSFYSIGAGATIDSVMYRASWFLASVVFGSVVSVAVAYIHRLRDAMRLVFRVSRRGRDAVLLVLMYLGFLSLFLSTLPYIERVDTWYIVSSLIWVLVLLPVLVILTTMAVGETGIAAQSLYPFNTVYLYITGSRGFAPYVFMDHYLGIPMPGSLSAASTNIIKLSRMSGLPPSRMLLYFSTSFILGLLVTMFYGITLIRVFGLDSSTMSLTRWLPYVNWSIMVYKGQLDLSTIGGGLLIGALYMMSILVIGYLFSIRISPLPFIIGMSLTPDYGLLFAIGSFARWYISRFGIEAQERLVVYSIALLVGSGLSIPLYILLSIFLPGVSGS